jgi:hypothetical protein
MPNRPASLTPRAAAAQVREEDPLQVSVSPDGRIAVVVLPAALLPTYVLCACERDGWHARDWDFEGFDAPRDADVATHAPLRAGGQRIAVEALGRVLACALGRSGAQSRR